MGLNQAALVVLGLAGLTACQDRDYEYTDDPEFDEEGVIFADAQVCLLVSASDSCVVENPVQWAPSNASSVEDMCVDNGYECCSQDLWISAAAAQCIAESDPRLTETMAKIVTLGCDTEYSAPIWGVWEGMDTLGLQGLGVHASTGVIEWYNDGTGVV